MGKSSLILLAALLVGCTTTKEKIVIQYVDRPVEIPAALRKPCAGVKLPSRWSEQSDATKMLNRQDLALAGCNGAKQDVIGLVDDHNLFLTSK